MQASFQAGRAASELGHQVVIKEKSPASCHHSTHPLPGAASGFYFASSLDSLLYHAQACLLEVCCLGGGVKTQVSVGQIEEGEEGPEVWRKCKSQVPHEAGDTTLPLSLC